MQECHCLGWGNFNLLRVNIFFGICPFVLWHNVNLKTNFVSIEKMWSNYSRVKPKTCSPYVHVCTLTTELNESIPIPVTLPFQRFQTLEIETATTSKFCNPHGLQTTSATHKADVPLTVWTLCHGQNVDQFRPSYYGSIFIMFISSPSVPKTFDLANQCYSWFLTP